MTELVFNTFLKEVSYMVKDEAFCAMYFGRHFEKNVLILQHEITVMIVFGGNLHWSAPEFIKTVSFRGDRKRGVQIVGNENIILLLDEGGNLWRLINAFEDATEINETFRLLKVDCFYEWVPFRKFNFVKVLALCEMQTGFACLGLCGDFGRKLVVMSSLDSALEDYTFEELITSPCNSVSYYLTNINLNIKNSGSEEGLLVTDQFNGKTFLCFKDGRNILVNISNNYLISALHLQQEECLLLCFENGKLVFCFYNKFWQQSVAYLSKKVVFVSCSPDCCLLWSDGISLIYTKLVIQPGEDVVKLFHLKLNCVIQNPLSVAKTEQGFLTVTMNNVYYYMTTGVSDAKIITKQTQELLSEIWNGSSHTEKLEEKTDLLAHYLQCKDIMQKHKAKGKVSIKWEDSCLVLKNCLEVTLREKFWKIQLMAVEPHKTSVHVVDLDMDVRKDGVIIIEYPFKSRCCMKVSLVGDFNGRDLFLDLEEVHKLEDDVENDKLRKQFQDILIKRNQYHIKKGNKSEFV